MRSARLAAGSLLLLATVTALVSAPRHGAAATATATMAVSATVLSVCTITATPMAFLNYAAPTGQNATATLTVLCTTATPYSVGLDAGTTAGATVQNRKMTNGTGTLNYNLTSDAAHTVNIGQTLGTDVLTGTGLGVAQVLTVYGRIPPNQFVTTGVYTDTVTATITY